MKKWLSLAVLLLFTATSFASASGAAFETLSKGIGVRALSMGGACTADVPDAAVVTWNPAQLDSVTKNEIYTSFEVIPEKVLFDYVSYVSPLGKIGGAGISVAYLTADDYEITGSTEEPNGTVSEILINGAFGRALFYGVQAGVNLKLLMQVIGRDSYSGFTADAGIFKSIADIIDIGLEGKNLVPMTERYSLPGEKFDPLVRLGLSRRVLDDRLRISGDAEKVFNASAVIFSLGMEYNIMNIIYLRGGCNTFRSLSGGIGAACGDICLDYGIGLTEVGVLHKAAVSYRFGGYELSLKAEPEIFSPLGRNKKAYIRIIARAKYAIYKWTVEVKNTNGETVRIWEGAGTPPETVIWDGLKKDGNPCEDGDYTARLIIMDENDTVIKSDEVKIKILIQKNFYVPIVEENN